MTITDYHVGQRVQTHPVTLAWWSGDRYGTVVKVGRKLVHVELDRSGRVKRFNPANLLEVES